VEDIGLVPRPQLLAVADLLEEAVGDFLNHRAQIRPDAQWEAPLEGWAISNLMVRNIQATILLARHDEVLAPAAWANTRNVLDAATRILWLLVPEDRFEAETRWVALLKEYERFHRRVAAILEEGGGPTARTHLESAEAVRGFHTAVSAKLPDGYSVPGIPPTDRVLREIGIGGMYQRYIEGSQYMHAGMHATSMYIDRDESGRMPTEAVTILDWMLPLQICWICLNNAGRFVINRLSPSAKWETARLGERIDAAFRALAESGFSGPDREPQD